ncbi:MAG: tyrosine-type recombinase/integrase, partial [Crocinitomicaceae bacterium]|nr:tyrosine-type recombinase/integrase [Crocinitomicaceae bacterium]
MEILLTKYYKRILEEFDTHIMSTKSIRRGNHYSGQVKRFLIYLEKRGILHLSEVDGEVMKEYFAYLSTRPKLKKGTGPLSAISINDCLCTLRTFSMRMVKGGEIERGLQIPNPVKIEHKSNNPFVLTRQVLTIEELKQVYKRANSLIDKSIIALAYGCGLRRMELESLRDNDIDFRKGVLTIIESKNNKTRSVPISNFFLQVLKEYNYHRLEILSKRGKRTRYFLLNDLGDKLSGEIMNKRLKSVIAKTKDQS